MPSENKIRGGLVANMLYQVSNGLSSTLFNELMENHAINHEEYVILYQEIANSVPNNIRTNIMWPRVMELYLERHPDLVKKTPCFFCDTNVTENEHFVIEMFDKEKGQINVRCCITCHKTLKKKVWKCSRCNIVVPNEVGFKCELFDKCSQYKVCPKPDCIELHNRNYHKTYQLRKWKAAKRYITKRPGDIAKLELPSGIEFEVIGAGGEASRKKIFKLNKHIGIGDDMSIRNFKHSMEVQTPPASGRRLEKMVLRTCDALAEGGFTVNGNCGTHVHIDLYKTFGKLTENPQFYKSLLTAYIYFENWWFSLLPKSRGDNRFVTHLLPRYKGLIQTDRQFWLKKKFSKCWYMTDSEDDIQRYKMEKNLSGPERCSGSAHHVTKYMAVNFHSMIRGEGLELRSLEGTIDPRVVLKWIDLHTQFILGISKLERPFHVWMYTNKLEGMIGQGSLKALDETIFKMIPFTEDAKVFIAERRLVNSRSANAGVAEGMNRRNLEILDYAGMHPFPAYEIQHAQPNRPRPQQRFRVGGMETRQGRTLSFVPGAARRGVTATIDLAEAAILQSRDVQRRMIERMQSETERPTVSHEFEPIPRFEDVYAEGPGAMPRRRMSEDIEVTL